MIAVQWPEWSWNHTTTGGAMIRSDAPTLLSTGLAESATASTYDLRILPDLTRADSVGQICVLPASDSATAAAALLEIRRLSGLTWDELADLFGVSRRSVHHWASDKAVSARHDWSIRRVLAVIHALDRGDAAQTRDVLIHPDRAGQVLFDQLKAGRFDEAMVRARNLPTITRPRPTPLSAEARRQRRPPPPALLVEALQDRPDIRTTALPKRFVRPPKRQG